LCTRWRDIPNSSAISAADINSGIVGAFERAAASLPIGVQSDVEHMAERIIDHVAGTWKPNLGRRVPARSLPSTDASSSAAPTLHTLEIRRCRSLQRVTR
jgi:hypothetical protein